MFARIKNSFVTTRDIGSRFGWGAALLSLAYRIVNKVMLVERLHIILLPRESLRPLRAKPGTELGSRGATLEDLEALRSDECWEIDDNKMRYFRLGDTCLLSYVNGKLAGYTWAHTGGMPELLPGLTIKVPAEYVYNYSGLTLEEFRGCGLQPYRHHALLNHERCHGCKGLLGYVRHTNWSSRAGQEKSGYRKIGSIWMIGAESRYLAFFSKELRSLGVKRIERRVASVTNDKALAGPP